MAEGQKHRPLSMPELLSPDSDGILDQIILYCGDLCLTVSRTLGLCSMMLVAPPCHGTPNIFISHMLSPLITADLLCSDNCRDIFEAVNVVCFSDTSIRKGSYGSWQLKRFGGTVQGTDVTYL